MKSNPKIQEFFLWLLAKDRLSVYDDGTVVNTLTNTIYSTIDNNGYKRINFTHKGKLWTMQSHRLIWVAFNGPTTNSKLVVNHINGIKSDNRLTNLELITNAANVQHAHRTKLIIPLVAEEKPNSTFSNAEVLELRREFSKLKTTVVHIAEQFNCHTITVKQMLTGITYSSILSEDTVACFNILKHKKRIASNSISNTMIKEISTLKAQGLSSYKISDKLGVSRNTVMKYW